MKPKTIKIIYWSILILFSLAMIMDGIGGVMRAEEGKVVLKHLGYPMYLMSILGVAKILGVVAVLQVKFQTIKEWAYAGFAFNFIGAIASRAFSGDEIGLLIPPVIMLAIMFIPYFLEKKIEGMEVSG